ncbi:MAG: hypothetical protein ACTSWN_04755 [Promethearchaeota archaeon]
MIIIKCASCNRKLFQYLKIGKGRILRCYKKRIMKIYDAFKEGEQWKCTCGNVFGSDKPGHIQMRKGTFYHRGSKL